MPETISEIRDFFVTMGLVAPEFCYPGTNHPDPVGMFQTAMMGLTAVRKKLGDDAYRYLSERLDENWTRLQEGQHRDLCLSFGEMGYFLTSRQFKKPPSEFDQLGEHTSVRGVPS